MKLFRIIDVSRFIFYCSYLLLSLTGSILHLALILDVATNDFLNP